MPKTLKQKQDEAAERRADYEERTPEDQLARLETRRGSSERERAKLMSRIEQRGKVTK